MADKIRAAELPDHTVIAHGNVVYVRNHPSPSWAWRGTNSSYVDDASIDAVLAAGATVLRYGSGVQTIGERGQVATIETGAGVTVTAYRSTTRAGGITVEIDTDDDRVLKVLAVNVNDGLVYP